MSPLDDMEDRLGKVWSTVSHLNAVKNTPQIREAYDKCQPLITEYYTGLGQNRELFEAVTSVLAVAFDLTPSELSGPIRYAELARTLQVPVGGRAPLADVRAAVLGLRLADLGWHRALEQDEGFRRGFFGFGAAQRPAGGRGRRRHRRR